MELSLQAYQTKAHMIPINEQELSVICTNMDKNIPEPGHKSTTIVTPQNLNQRNSIYIGKQIFLSQQ